MIFHSTPLLVCAVGLLSFSVTAFAHGIPEAGKPKKKNRWKVADVVAGNTKPFAIGHRGFGVNLGEDPTRPTENTVRAVREGFLRGASMVEVDVQLTKDGRAVVFYDDVLADGTCINTLSLRELRRVAGEIPTLKEVLKIAHRFTFQQDGPSGIIDIEIKASSPNCDPDDGFDSDSMLVNAVVFDVTQADMIDQALIESFSPAVVALAEAAAPEIARVLSVLIVQLLTPTEILDATGLEVILIEKSAGFGLQWAEVGGLFRLPGYDSIEQFTGVALALSSTVIALDIQILQQTELSSGILLVSGLKDSGLSIWSFTVADEAGWEFISALGIDGIYIDDVPLGISLQSAQV